MDKFIKSYICTENALKTFKTSNKKLMHHCKRLRIVDKHYWVLYPYYVFTIRTNIITS